MRHCKASDACNGTPTTGLVLVVVPLWFLSSLLGAAGIELDVSCCCRGVPLILLSVSVRVVSTAGAPGPQRLFAAKTAAQENTTVHYSFEMI
jgi:hypothetical protein